MVRSYNGRQFQQTTEQAEISIPQNEKMRSCRLITRILRGATIDVTSIHTCVVEVKALIYLS